jgi:hypothetical protein
MLSRIRAALGLALVLILLHTATAFAKGNFSFLSISGKNMKVEVRTADRNLTVDWFAFADFSGGSILAPAHPPEGGFVITRYYVDGGSADPFDQLLYFPAAGLVYYHGLLGGSSEYDGKWYAAKPQIETVFENALAVELQRHTPVIRKR